MTQGLSSVDPKELGERLRRARTRADVTQEQAAQIIGLSRPTLVAIEKGQRRPQPEELVALAAAYNVGVAELLRRTAVHVDFVPRFRASLRGKDGAKLEAAARLNDLTAAEVELENLVGPMRRSPLPPERPLMSGDVRDQAEDAAMELRMRHGLGYAPIQDIVSLLEQEFGIRVFLDKLDYGVSGLYAYDSQIGPCILFNSEHPPTRRAMTGAHELGHFIGTRNQPDIVYEGEPEDPREEVYANAFAAAFLMPAQAVRRMYQEYQEVSGKFTPRHLILMAHRWNVSEEAMCLRLEGLKLLKRGTWHSLKDRKFGGDLVREVIGEQKSRELVPPRLWLLAAEAFEKELLTEGQLARLLRVDRVRLREIADSYGVEGENGLDALDAD
ncbi:DNA-binding protein [Hyphomonas neptunium ATCC 15444]|uniref:DNA-binding protein n=2 Tax=Hyphomonas TaxID=85 RepID=Q0C5H7_HYPNA|nr:MULTISPECIES: XRE family transcriptional regulator [Hyphomonas]ABI78223.1 DNA-binding protein [Hyphomonas neptunium ATCC 15444]KCZ95450.1 DNA-binding protein [Hyphomonas hirschiana VP5]